MDPEKETQVSEGDRIVRLLPMRHPLRCLLDFRLVPQVSKRMYFKLLPIAKGQPPVDGIDGRLLFSKVR